MQPINWGILGPGKIAHKFVQGLQTLPDARFYSAGSRSVERAKKFAGEYGATKAFGSYRELAEDPDTNIIYVATPHPFHYENTLLCLENSKPVLCEKPFTINTRQLKHLIEVARRKKVFLMEALWSRFVPSIMGILEISNSGKLGAVRFVNADFGFRGEYDPLNRMFNPELGGGALLDIGIYPVFLAMLLLGEPDRIKAAARFASTGVDESTSMIFLYNNGNIANLSCTFMADTPIQADVIFEKGRVRLNPKWFTPTSLTLVHEDRTEENILFDEPGNGYQYQAVECMRCLREGLTESPVMNLDFSLSLMEVLDRIRKECGLVYPIYD
jgi:predicted dehydrogenase